MWRGCLPKIKKVGKTLHSLTHNTANKKACDFSKAFYIFCLVTLPFREEALPTIYPTNIQLFLQMCIKCASKIYSITSYKLSPIFIMLFNILTFIYNYFCLA